VHAVRLSHHELCFGCGLANLFGLAIELEPGADGAVTGRFFLKQDHQGPDGTAHPGIIGAALAEAMTLLVDADRADAGGSPAQTTRLEIDYRAPAPVGSFVEVRAWLERREERRSLARAVASSPDSDIPLAEARAVLSRTAEVG
jgi:acyl-coenzyme A thioesterase PaaI-like protein